MYHTWFFQKRLAEALDHRLPGMQLLSCFSQRKDELVMGFGSAKDELFILADLAGEAGLLAFKNEFARARKNSVNLFDPLIGAEVKKVEAYRHDRSFHIDFTDGHQLVFKMHARRSNVLLARQDEVLSIFRNNLHADMELAPSSLSKEIKMDKPNILLLLGKKNEHLIDNQDFDTNQFIYKINQNKLFVGLEKDLPVLKMVEILHPALVTDNPLEASNKLTELYHQHYVFGKEKERTRNEIEKEIRQSEGYIDKSSAKLEELKTRRDPREIADLIMANLHTIPTGANKVKVFDFYTNSQTDIKLNPKLSPQHNAEQYYRKSKNKSLELTKVRENIELKRQQILLRKHELEALESITTLKELRAFRTKHSDKPEQQETTLPYWVHEADGYQILVGKNAKANDLLTTRVAGKNDLWLHARDVPGSHVVIREKPGRNFPNSVIEKAAALAAWYSKRKNDSLCPVMYTPRKFVRKVKGAAPGQVVVEKEQVVMVVPNNKIE